MTEQEYRELMGFTVNFHILLDPECTKDEYEIFSQEVCDACFKMAHYVHQNSNLEKLVLFTMNKDEPSAPQLSMYYDGKDVYLGEFTIEGHKMSPCVSRGHLRSEELSTQLQALCQRAYTVTDFSTDKITSHVPERLGKIWEDYISKWPELEEKLRSDRQIVDRISPKTPEIYRSAKTLLDKSGVLYIEGGDKKNPTLYLTKRAREVIEEARHGDVFKSVYEDQITSEYLKCFKAHADKIDIKSVENGVITIAPKSGPNKDIDIKFDTRIASIDLVKNGRSLLKPGEHKDMSIIRDVLREEKRGKAKISRDDDER